MKTSALITTLAVASFGIPAGAYYALRPANAPVRFETATVTRGDIVSNVVCTGALQARHTVEVGTQADGIIKELNADFNSIVHRGDVLARLDSALIQAQIDQGRADIEKARSEVEQLRVTADEAGRNLERARDLHARQLITPSDLEDAQVAEAVAAADVKAATDRVAQAQANVKALETGLRHTIITSPVDGIVVARDVDVGQTVVSRMEAQTLFEIANDLRQMQVMATVDESDVGRVRVGQPVTFTVEAYPDRKYTGTVALVRENPTIDQNVVSYITVVDVSNPDLTLRPGMTASLAIRTDSRTEALRVPTAALRFKPFEQVFQALHQPVPASLLQAEKRKSDQRQVWVLNGGRLQPVALRIGLADDTATEAIGASLQPGDKVVTDAVLTR
jgi:HlyD family secretion protein